LVRTSSISAAWAQTTACALVSGRARSEIDLDAAELAGLALRPEDSAWPAVLPFLTSELFSFEKSGFSTTQGGMSSIRVSPSANLLPDGKVLVAGGNTCFYNGFDGRTLSAAELFDPVAGTFTAVADMTTPRESHTATLLLNGEMLMVGGSVGTLGYSITTTVVATTELYQ